jgi:crotonobetainyl-CoA:carnitine CoA-transferase CaiB-like acyl-CoA transferase
MSHGALRGLRVLDLSRLLPGAYLTMLLADHGADVLKVEQPGSGDGLRVTPPWTAQGEGAVHVALNRGKGSAALDLRSPAGREALLGLVDGADVVVESFRPGVLDRLGLGWEVLHARRPSLVLVSVTAYGPDGEDGSAGAASLVPGHDLNAQAGAGALLLAGDGTPTVPATQGADLGAALHAAVGVLAALRHAGSTGEGQRVEVSMADAALSLLPIATSTVAVTGRAPEPGGDALTGALACYSTYRCADGEWLAVAALEPKFFAAFTAVLGEPELAAWQFDPGRQDELRARLSAAIGARDRHEWLDLLQGHDTCVSPVRDVASGMDVARARGSVVDAPLPGGTTFAQVAPVARLSLTPGRVGGHPSALGADTPASAAADDVVGGAS